MSARAAQEETTPAASVTLSVTIDAPYDTAFDYVADGRRLAEWSTGFIFAVKEQGADLVASTPYGDLPLRVIADRESGAVDNVIGDARYRGRLIPNGRGVDYVFTLHQPPNMPDEAWERDGIQGLRQELENLRKVLESRR